MSATASLVASATPANRLVSAEQVTDVVNRACPADACRGQRVLAIVPDGTRTAPVGLLFKALHDAVGGAVRQLDVMIALGTHQPMSEEAICQRLEISMEERRAKYPAVGFINHE